MTSEEILRYELRNAAVHEAAHVVVSRRLGYPANASVVPTGAPPSTAGQYKSFTGKTFLYNMPPDPMRMVCLAGTVAEQYDGDPDVDGLSLMDWLESETTELSATDADGAGAYTVKDLDRCIGLVRSAWTEIEVEAGRLAEDGMRLYRQMQEKPDA